MSTDAIAIFDREKFQAAVTGLGATAAGIAEAGEQSKALAASIAAEAAAQANAAGEPGSAAAAVGPAMNRFMAALVDCSAELAAEVPPIAEQLHGTVRELQSFYDEQTATDDDAADVVAEMGESGP